MLNKGLGALAGIGATACIGSLITIFQGAKHPGWLWAFAVAGAIVFVIAGIGWLFTREDSSPKIAFTADHQAAQAIGPQSVAAGRDIHVNISPAAPTRRSEIEVEPVLIEGNMSNLYVVLKVRTTLVPRMKGRLEKVEPASRGSAIVVDNPIVGLPKWEFAPGLLQWSARYGGGKEADVAGECDLDVLAFEGNDPRGRFVYLDPKLRDDKKLILDNDLAWRITVHVFAESGEQKRCSFKIAKGNVIWRLEFGGLYRPELSEIRSW